MLKEHPEVFTTPEGEVDHDEGRNRKVVVGGRDFVVTRAQEERDDLLEVCVPIPRI